MYAGTPVRSRELFSILIIPFLQTPVSQSIYQQLELSIIFASITLLFLIFIDIFHLLICHTK
jgi:hypothetical protein